MSNIGKNIKRIRKEKGFTQHQVAKFVGMSDNVVSNWERGDNKPDADTIELLMELFNVDANTIFGWDDKKQLENDALTFVKSVESVVEDIGVDNLSEGDKELLINFVKRLADPRRGE